MLVYKKNVLFVSFYFPALRAVFCVELLFFNYMLCVALFSPWLPAFPLRQ